MKLIETMAEAVVLWGTHRASPKSSCVGRTPMADNPIYSSTNTRREPDLNMVICPNCVHQFPAIPVNVQHRLAEAENDLADLRRLHEVFTAEAVGKIPQVHPKEGDHA